MKILLTGSSGFFSKEFIKYFAKVDKLFGDNVLMTPHYIFQPCMHDSCTPDYKNLHCFADGKYCSGDLTHP